MVTFKILILNELFQPLIRIAIKTPHNPSVQTPFPMSATPGKIWIKYMIIKDFISPTLRQHF